MAIPVATQTQLKSDNQVRSTFNPSSDFVLVEREAAATEDDGILLAERYQYKGFISKVVRIGDGVGLPLNVGDTVLVQPSCTMNAFGNKSQMAIVKASGIIALLKGEENHEEFYPVNSWYLYEPDAVVDISKGVHLPDQAKLYPCTGKLLRVPHSETELKGGEAVSFQYSVMIPAVQNGIDVLFGQKPIAIFVDGAVFPLDTRLVVETVLPKVCLGDINLAEKYVREPSIATIKEIGPDVEDVSLNIGDVVELERVNPSFFPAGIRFDPLNLRLRVVDEKSILGVYDDE